MKPEDSGTRVYFKLIFDTANDIEAQAAGGIVWNQLTRLVAEDRSAWYRGMVTKESDASTGLSEPCIPYAGENCDPDREDHFILYFLICLGGSLVFQVLVIGIWYLWTSKRRWETYQQRVEEVADRLRKLNKANQEQGGHTRFVMRDVSRTRARDIYLK